MGVPRFLLLCFVIFFSVNPSLGQKMLKKIHKQNQTINPSLGFRAGEPMGINIQLYKGQTESCVKSKSIVDLLIAKEGTVFSLGPNYQIGAWRPGGNRFGLSWFHELNHQHLKQYVYYGVGIQGGSRKYQRGTEHFTENFVWGPHLTIQGELPLKIMTITPQELYCKITLFAEVVYHKEVGGDFSYVKPAGGVRFNWFY